MHYEEIRSLNIVVQTRVVNPKLLQKVSNTSPLSIHYQQQRRIHNNNTKDCLKDRTEKPYIIDKRKRKRKSPIPFSTKTTSSITTAPTATVFFLVYKVNGTSFLQESSFRLFIHRKYQTKQYKQKLIIP